MKKEFLVELIEKKGLCQALTEARERGVLVRTYVPDWKEEPLSLVVELSNGKSVYVEGAWTDSPKVYS